MHIAYLIQQFAPEVGAGPARATEMATRWLDAGARVTIVTGMPNRPQGRVFPEYRGRVFLEEEWEGMRVLRSWLYASPKHGFARTIANNASFMVSATAHALARMGRPDVIIASAPPFFPHLAGWVIGVARRVPIVLEMRDLWPDYLVDMGMLSRSSVGARALFGLERFLIRRAHHSVVVTDSFRRRLLTKGAKAGAVSVIPNGVDLRQYYRSDEPPPLPGMEPSAGRPVVGYLGNMGAGQGLANVIQAAKRVRAENSSVRFVLAGDGPERRALERLVREERLDNVAIHPPIPKARTRAFYNACDVCLVPLADVPVFQETVPSKIFEVMACERPVLAILGGEAARIVQRSGAGLVAAPGDAGAVAGALYELLSLADQVRVGMGRKGREYVAQHYERAALADRYRNILERLVAPAPAANPVQAPTVSL